MGVKSCHSSSIKKKSFQMLGFLRRYYYTPVKSCSNETYIYICNLNEKYLKVMLNCFLISIDCFYRRIWHCNQVVYAFMIIYAMEKICGF